MNEIEKTIKILKEQCNANIEIANRIDLVTATYIAIEALEKQLNGGWIPTSEKLPEISDMYLVTFTENNKNYVERFYYSIINGWMMPVNWQDEGHIDEFIAWQPLPEPYKEVEDERNNIRND